LLRMRDRFWGFLRSLRRFRIDHFSDHNMGEYIEAIRRAVEKEYERSRDRPRDAPKPHKRVVQVQSEKVG
ncbi:MAG: hypothetical protein KDA37_07095, partial [Planctomycetales bacterium]|nr:hypothetical protein [Planctomycetales bacterium]